MKNLNFDELTSTIVKTIGFADLTDTLQDEIMRIGLSKITQATDFLVFVPSPKGVKNEIYEDEGKTLKIPFNAEELKEKVYVKLDDYKGNEQENFNKRFVITFMLANEY